MSSSEGSTHLPSPPGSGAQPPSDNAATPNTAAAPFLPSSLFGGPLAASPFTTSYTPFQTVSSVSNTSSRASVKQHSRAEVVSRTVHLRCLPPSMKQRELADVFDLCGEYLRVRICGNAATHQKWVYGFVEFAKVEAVAVMLTHSGMELSNGADKPPLRLKCSPSKQPILDCMAYDADVVSGTPCGFGRGYLADCTLNDALLVVGSSGVAAAQTGSASGGSAKNNGKSGCASGGGGRRAAANRALTALTISSIRKTAATGCGCGCSGVNCCDCCRCWKGEKAEGGEEKGAAAAVGGGCCGGGGDGGATATTATVTTGKSDEGGLTTATTELLTRASFAEAPATDFTKTSATFADLTLLPSSMNAGELDVMQRLAAAFQGLRTTAAAEEGPLDGPAMVRRAETMALDALTRASHLSSDTRIQDILCDLGQLLSFLDGGAAVTGGAAQTASGDCTATLPQRVTQLRMLANLVGALLCLLRRSVADAVPYVEAVLVTFAQIPPSSLLLRARQHERDVRAAAKSGGDATKTNAKDATVAGGGATAPLFDLNGVSKRTGDTTQGLGFAAFALGAFSEEDVTDNLLDMVDEDDDVDDDGHVSGDGCSPHAASGSRACTDGDEAPDRHTCSKASAAQAALQRQLLNGSRSASLSSDESVAFLNSADMVDLCRRDEAFTRYILNVVVSIGIAMESVQPMIARSAYTLANTRAAEVLTEPSAMVAACLAACAASPASPPRLCETLFKEAGANGKARDITFFPHRFFESVAAMRQKVKDTRGTECFWRQLPPNHVVPLYKF